jgi:hypothetical protein
MAMAMAMETPIVSSPGERIKVMVCTGNIGSEQPDIDSVNAWIPKDGCTKCVLGNQNSPYLYPIQNKNQAQASSSPEEILKSAASASALVANKSSSVISTSNTRMPQRQSSDSIQVQAAPAASLIQEENGNEMQDRSSEGSSCTHFDIIVIGMQEASFDTADHENKKQNTLSNNIRQSVSVVKTMNSLTNTRDHMEHTNVIVDKYTRSFRRKTSSDSTKRPNDTQILHDLLK